MVSYFFKTRVIYLWSFFVFFVEKLFLFFSYFNFLQKFQIKNRFFTNEILKSIGKEASQKEKRVCFFLSSAGEYEQISPILHELRDRKDTFIYLIFMSPSGYKFAEKRNETIHFHLAPFDCLSHWEKFYSSIGSSTTYVVRHELWPSFLLCASQAGPLYLLNASCPFEDEFFVKKKIKQELYQFFTKIFLIDECFKELFFCNYNVDKSKMIISGDSKYGSVLLRKKISEDKVSFLEKKFFERYEERKLHLIAGSVWYPDVLLLVKALRELRFLYKLNVRVTLVPHKLSQKFLEKIKNLCVNYGLSYTFFSEFSIGEKIDPDVLIFDEMGSLAEIYALGDIAYLGGGLHARVHNVLEAVAYGLAVSFGPRYSTSYEAIKLLNSQLAEVVHTPSEIVNWCSYHFDAKFSRKRALLNYLSEQQNTTRIVLETTYVRKEIDYQ